MISDIFGIMCAFERLYQDIKEIINDITTNTLSHITHNSKSHMIRPKSYSFTLPVMGNDSARPHLTLKTQ